MLRFEDNMFNISLYYHAQDQCYYLSMNGHRFDSANTVEELIQVVQAHRTGYTLFDESGTTVDWELS